jgi:hypothetical protein
MKLLRLKAVLNCVSRAREAIARRKSISSEVVAYARFCGQAATVTYDLQNPSSPPVVAQ